MSTFKNSITLGLLGRHIIELFLLPAILFVLLCRHSLSTVFFGRKEARARKVPSVCVFQGLQLKSPTVRDSVFLSPTAASTE